MSATKSSHRRAAVAALTALGATACGRSGDAPTALALGDRLVADAQALQALLTSRAVLFFPIAVLLGWAASRALKVLVLTAWRLGIDPQHRLGRYRALWDFGLALAVAWAIVARLVAAAPILALGGLGLALGALTVALREQIQNVAVGLAIVARRRLRDGDRVIIGELAGTVTRVELTRIELRRPDGARIHIPARLLGQQALVVGHAKHTVPVAATVEITPGNEAAAATIARRVALLSPYRAVGSTVDIQRLEGSVRVEIQAWSASAADDARAQLEASLSRELGAGAPRVG